MNKRFKRMGVFDSPLCRKASGGRTSDARLAGRNGFVVGAIFLTLFRGGIPPQAVVAMEPLDAIAAGDSHNLIGVAQATRSQPDAAENPLVRWVKRPLDRAGRYMGAGHGDGYHGCYGSGFRPGADLPPISGHATRRGGRTSRSSAGLTYYDHFDNQTRLDSGSGPAGCAEHCGLPNRRNQIAASPNAASPNAASQIAVNQIAASPMISSMPSGIDLPPRIVASNRQVLDQLSLPQGWSEQIFSLVDAPAANPTSLPAIGSGAGGNGRVATRQTVQSVAATPPPAKSTTASAAGRLAARSARSPGDTRGSVQFAWPERLPRVKSAAKVAPTQRPVRSNKPARVAEVPTGFQNAASSVQTNPFVR